MGLIGTNIKQQAGFSAFIPNAFPPSPMPNLDEESISLLEAATRSLGKLDGIAELLPDVNFFILMNVRRESTSSSQLEGTQATMIDVLRAEQMLPVESTSDYLDIVRHIEALNFGLARIKSLPLSIRLLCEVHKILMTDARSSTNATPGEIRTTQNWIGGTSPQNARYVPPPAYLVREHLSNIERYLHLDAPDSKLIRTALSHAQFETIHPFSDGNGRTGRLLMTFYLCQEGLLSRPVLYMSDYLKRYRETYFDRLHAYHQGDEILAWVKFFLEGVNVVSLSGIDVCKGITKLRENDLVRVAKLGRAAPNATRALRVLYNNPIVSVGTLSKELGMSRTNANKLAAKLVEIGILNLSDENVDYGRTFVHTEYLELFLSN